MGARTRENKKDRRIRERNEMARTRMRIPGVRTRDAYCLEGAEKMQQGPSEGSNVNYCEFNLYQYLREEGGWRWRGNEWPIIRAAEKGEERTNEEGVYSNSTRERDGTIL